MLSLEFPPGAIKPSLNFVELGEAAPPILDGRLRALD